MKPITNLNLLDKEKLILDDEDRIFIVLSIYTNIDGTATLKLVETNDEFTQYSMTVPVACDSEYKFTSIKDKNMVFKFFELDITLKEIATIIRNEARKSIDKSLKGK